MIEKVKATRRGWLVTADSEEREVLRGYKKADGELEANLKKWFKDGNKAEPRVPKEERLAQNAVARDREFTKMNSKYGDLTVSIASSDALGLLQVESAFNKGLESTNFMFKNGTKMMLTTDNFEAFSLWFVMERSKLFV